MKEDENISAFAFKTGRLIEDLINKETNNLKEENKLLQARILNFYCKLNDNVEVYYYTPDLVQEYKEYFNIETLTKGKI